MFIVIATITIHLWEIRLKKKKSINIIVNKVFLNNFLNSENFKQIEKDLMALLAHILMDYINTLTYMLNNFML